MIIQVLIQFQSLIIALVVLNLSFEGIDKMDAFHVQNEWKWNTLCKGDDGSKSRDMACVMINEKTALTMGGCNIKRKDICDTKAVDIFDFETRELEFIEPVEPNPFIYQIYFYL